MKRLLLACAVLWGCFVFGISHAEEEELYEEVEERRLEACGKMARMIRDYLMRATAPHKVLEEFGTPFCKWCRDLDRDEYRAVCPK